ncbi:superoxide dismutase [Sphingomonas lenta]|uniref:Superoxide dismutase n=2 Tax=Sphingomonas lenta TaxID=1141887 RepID=A0A2A2SIS6_9SPHN|nr:superoxide dismutase [Sphingomonas lenta]
MPHVRAEAARAWELMKAGVIRENYLRADGSGAVCMLECSGVEEARSIMEAFPLSTAGVIGFDFIELRNFDVLEILFDESNEGSSSTSH